MRRSLALGLAAAGLALAANTVTIWDSVTGGHACLQKCLYYPFVYTDIGSAIQCEYPYEDTCYCATAAASVSLVMDFLPSCATRYCAAGDRTADMSAMSSIYADYCASAGFPADRGVDAGPTTADGGSPPRETGGGAVSTRMTVVTQTATPDEGGAPTSTGDNVRVVDATSTVWVDADGNIIDEPKKKSGLGVGAIVGICVGVAALLLTVVVVWCIVKKRRPRHSNAHLAVAQTYPPLQQQQQPHIQSFQQNNRMTATNQTYNQNFAQYPPPPPSVSPMTTGGPPTPPAANKSVAVAATAVSSPILAGATTVSSPIPTMATPVPTVSSPALTAPRPPVSPVSAPATPVPATPVPATPPPGYSAEISAVASPRLLPNTLASPPAGLPARGAEMPANQYRGAEMPANQYRGAEMPTNQYRGAEMPSNQYRSAEMPANRPTGAGLPTAGPRANMIPPASPARGAEMSANSPLFRRPELDARSHGGPPRPVEMGIVGHSPATQFEMPASPGAHGMRRAGEVHEMAVDGHLPASHYEMSGGDVARRAELGGGGPPRGW